MKTVAKLEKQLNQRIEELKIWHAEEVITSWINQDGAVLIVIDEPHRMVYPCDSFKAAMAFLPDLLKTHFPKS